jgi:hypothetical protein
MPDCRFVIMNAIAVALLLGVVLYLCHHRTTRIEEPFLSAEEMDAKARYLKYKPCSQLTGLVDDPRFGRIRALVSSNRIKGSSENPDICYLEMDPQGLVDPLLESDESQCQEIFGGRVQEVKDPASLLKSEKCVLDLGGGVVTPGWLDSLNRKLPPLLDEAGDDSNRTPTPTPTTTGSVIGDRIRDALASIKVPVVEELTTTPDIDCDMTAEQIQALITKVRAAMGLYIDANHSRDLSIIKGVVADFLESIPLHQNLFESMIASLGSDPLQTFAKETLQQNLQFLRSTSSLEITRSQTMSSLKSKGLHDIVFGSRGYGTPEVSSLINTPSLDACVNDCARRPTCKSIYLGWQNGDLSAGTSPNYECYMFSDKFAPSTANVRRNFNDKEGMTANVTPVEAELPDVLELESQQTYTFGITFFDQTQNVAFGRAVNVLTQDNGFTKTFTEADGLPSSFMRANISFWSRVSAEITYEYAESPGIQTIQQDEATIVYLTSNQPGPLKFLTVRVKNKVDVEMKRRFELLSPSTIPVDLSSAEMEILWAKIRSILDLYDPTQVKEEEKVKVRERVRRFARQLPFNSTLFAYIDKSADLRNPMHVAFALELSRMRNEKKIGPYDLDTVSGIKDIAFSTGVPAAVPGTGTRGTPVQNAGECMKQCLDDSGCRAFYTKEFDSVSNACMLFPEPFSHMTRARDRSDPEGVTANRA